MSQNEPAPAVAFPEGSRGLNVLQVFVAFALVLGAVLVGLRKIDALADPVAEVDRVYRDAVSANLSDGTPVAHAAEGAPQLNPAGRAALGLVSDPVRLSDHTILEGEVLEGVYVIEAGAAVVLRDVTLRGTIVAESQLEGGAAGPSWLMLQGNVRLEPGDVLPGLAVMLPRGSVIADEPESALQIQGDVVAQRVELAGRAALFGRLLTDQTPVLSSKVEQFDAPPTPSTGHELAPDDTDFQALTSFEFP